MSEFEGVLIFGLDIKVFVVEGEIDVEVWLFLESVVVKY